MKSISLFFVAMCAIFSGYAQSPLVLRAQSLYTEGSGGFLVIADSLTHMHLNGRSSVVSVPVVATGYPGGDGYVDDTTTRYGIAGPSQRYYRRFNTAGLVTEFTQENLGANPGIIRQTLYSYNSAMLVDTVKEFFNNSGSMKAFTYANGDTLTTTVYNWDPSQTNWQLSARDSCATIVTGSDSTVFKYNEGPGGFYEFSRHKFTRNANKLAISDSSFMMGALKGVNYYDYNAAGKLRLDSFAYWSSGQLKPAHKRTCNYDAQNRLITDLRSVWSNQASQYVFNEETEYVFDAPGNLMLVKKTEPNGNIVLDSFFYNNNNQLVRAASYDESGANVTLQGVRYFYYWFPVGVEEVAAANSFQLYPVPATSYLNLSMSFVKPQAFSVYIFDMQGRLMQQWQEAAQQTYNKRIPVTTLAPGQYTVHILAAGESCSKQFTVVR